MSSRPAARHRRTLALLLATSSAIVALGGAAGTSHAASLSTWEKLAECESGGDWTIVSSGSVTYYGGLQFSLSTWQSIGGTQYAAYPHQATKNEQILMGEKLLDLYGEGQWPVCGPKVGLGSDPGEPFPEDVPPAPVFTQTAAADFTGDGEADIIARDGAGKLKMWKHNPEGFFNSAVDVTSGWNFTQTVAGDFNNDNKADIVARDADANLKMWLGRGDGTFNAAVQVTAGWNFTQTAAADFDGNGKDDLIARDASGNLKIWAGRGDGTFGAAAQVSSGWNFTQTAAADFNGDNQADIIAKDASGNLKLWTHNPAGVFNPAVTVTGGWNFSQTTAADVDGNGKADLIARNDSTGDLTIWAGRGDTTFGAPNVLTSGW
ncbi:FG-GAP-like repeat-containing protein [Streptomyces sp. NPDC047974]|uniref:FG-GAP-like repeat-containing protein n=1 Tax=Streptomyces sp. NPDC047974 TaxID=3154343 RepID=UPI0033C78500